jgi:hypothetical protein
MVDQGLGKNAKTLALTSPIYTLSATDYRDLARTVPGGWDDPYGRKPHHAHRGHRDKDDDPEKKALSYVPEVRLMFRYLRHLLTPSSFVCRSENMSSGGSGTA